MTNDNMGSGTPNSKCLREFTLYKHDQSEVRFRRWGHHYAHLQFLDENDMKRNEWSEQITLSLADWRKIAHHILAVTGDPSEVNRG